MDRLSLMTARPDEILTPEVCARARRVVAMHADGAADCRDLLEALGLIDPPAEAAGTTTCPNCHTRHRPAGRSRAAKYCSAACAEGGPKQEPPPPPLGRAG